MHNSCRMHILMCTIALHPPLLAFFQCYCAGQGKFYFREGVQTLMPLVWSTLPVIRMTTTPVYGPWAPVSGVCIPHTHWWPSTPVDGSQRPLCELEHPTLRSSLSADRTRLSASLASVKAGTLPPLRRRPWTMRLSRPRTTRQRQTAKMRRSPSTLRSTTPLRKPSVKVSV